MSIAFAVRVLHVALAGIVVGACQPADNAPEVEYI